jgi:hypothetical protein
LFDRLESLGFGVTCTSHARAIVEADFPEILDELGGCLAGVRIPLSEILGSGGGEAHATQRLRHALAGLGWSKTTFVIKKTINDVERESQSHEVDHVRSFGARGQVALEIEWNNKDPFFDRDLENFKRLHAEGGISLGVIVTRGASLQTALFDLVRNYGIAEGFRSIDDLKAAGFALTPRQAQAIVLKTTRVSDPVPFAEAWAAQFVSDKFGAATTHWSKLMERVKRGVGNPCPLILIGLPVGVIDVAS